MRIIKEGCVVSIAGLAVVLMAVSIASLGAADPPGRVNFQGMARDAGGTVLDGPVAMVFRLYDDPTAGTILWEETYDAVVHPPAVTVSAGLFTVALGDIAHRTAGSESSFQAVFANHAAVYLGAEVGEDTEMTPRISVVSTPFAVNSDALGGMHADDFAEAVHAHDASAISTGTLLAARGGTGLASPGMSGNLLTSNGSTWTSAVAPTAASTGAVVDAANTTLTRSGAGTGGSPFKLAMNLANANTWTGVQTFSANTSFPGSGIWTSTGCVGIGIVTPDASFKLDVRSSLSNGIAIQGIGPGAGGYFKDSDDGGYAEVGVGDTGIDAGGKGMGGAFYDLDSSGTAFVGYGDRGIEAYGNVAGGYFKDADSSGVASVGVANHGIDAFGNEVGGYFKDANSSGYGWVGYGDIGIAASGNHAGGFFVDSDNGSNAWVAIYDSGIDAYGSGRGGYFKDTYDSGYSYVAIDNYGIQSFGTYAGGHFDDSDGNSWADVSYSTYKIYGTGTVSFVQNHPTEKDKVIVYACPEGDEVATYTRGTARLVNGEARVVLGETFQWVTNPDLGLTAHITPKTQDGVLYVESVSTSELVVKSVKGFAPDATFDYLVYGLRIGFEESSIVQEKQRESFIPSFKDHRERYSKYPKLRAFNALERFKGMEAEVAPSKAMDLTRAEALKASIHEYDPATDPPTHELFGHGPGPLPSPAEAGPTANRQAPEPMRLASPTSLPGADIVGRKVSDPAAQAPSASLAPSLTPERFPVCEPVEEGDVLVSSAAHPGVFCQGRQAADPKVVGLATGRAATPAESSSDGGAYPLVPMATSGIVACKADAAFGPIAVGDLLTTSPTAGHAMRAQSPAPGTVVGKALEPLEGGTGVIRILVMLR